MRIKYIITSGVPRLVFFELYAHWAGIGCRSANAYAALVRGVESNHQTRDTESTWRFDQRHDLT